MAALGGLDVRLRVCTRVVAQHLVSITRFPLRRLSPGAGLLRYVCFIGSGEDFPGAGSKKTGIF